MGTDGSHLPDTTFGVGLSVIVCEDNKVIGMILTGSKCAVKEVMTPLQAEQYRIISSMLTLHIKCPQ